MSSCWRQKAITSVTERSEVTRVVWTGNGVAICEAKQIKNPTADAQPRSNGLCRNCKGVVRDAPHHRAMGGLCGSCAFDEYDC